MNSDQPDTLGPMRSAAPGAEQGSGAADASRRDDGSGSGIDAASLAGDIGAGPAASADALADLERKLAELQDRYLRTVAEVENVRRRSSDEVERARKFGIEAFAESLLPVKDSLELALAADVTDVANMREGVGATLQLLGRAFEKNRLLEIDPAGQKFDPNLHQAISTVPAAGLQPPVAPGHVAHVLQKGYLIADRVLRPALVTVVQEQNS